MPVELPENQVDAPPLQEPLMDRGGNVNIAWARWFEAIYMRTSYQGGNAIDTTNENVTGVYDELAVDILVNRGMIQQSRNRIFGDYEPEAYDDTGTSYSRGDYMVLGALGSGGDYYYRAKQAIAAPAGPFNAAIWDKIALNAGFLLRDYVEYGAARALAVSFQGRSTNGAVTAAHSYNMASLNRVSAGVYEGAMTQTTYFGASLLSKSTPVITPAIAASASTAIFTVDYTDLGSGNFRLSVYEVTKGAGNDLVKTPYDHTAANDKVHFILLANLGTGVLPPA